MEKWVFCNINFTYKHIAKYPFRQNWVFCNLQRHLKIIISFLYGEKGILQHENEKRVFCNMAPRKKGILQSFSKKIETTVLPCIESF